MSWGQQIDWRRAAVEMAFAGSRVLLCYPTPKAAWGKFLDLKQYLAIERVAVVEEARQAKVNFSSGGSVWITQLAPKYAESDMRFVGMEFDVCNALAERNKYVHRSVYERTKA